MSGTLGFLVRRDVAAARSPPGQPPAHALSPAGPASGPGSGAGAPFALVAPRPQPSASVASAPLWAPDSPPALRVRLHSLDASPVTALGAPPAFPSIAAAVEAALPGQTILVEPGVYHEELCITKPIQVCGACVWGGMGALRVEGGTAAEVGGGLQGWASGSGHVPVRVG